MHSLNFLNPPSLRLSFGLSISTTAGRAEVLFSLMALSLCLSASCSPKDKKGLKDLDPDSSSEESSASAQEDPLNPTDPYQQAMLGWRFHTGTGQLQDFAEGVKWYRKAAEQGVPIAQVALGNCYALGEGVERNLDTAAEWFGEAAAQGDADGQFRLAICYESGAGVESDFTQAYMWYNLAAASKQKGTAANARANQAALAREMSREQIADAQRMSREWKKR
ncbi:MAG: sel1 repeat family protein [Verrucomicrobiaceae bacterium]|nr:MAG: sel1 repeat family protein [Verrucomicrobiaceae bacterium]